MKRFTRKYNKDEIAKQNLNADYSEHIISKEDYTIDPRQPVQEGLNKFGQLEDIEEKHGVESTDDLDKRLKALEITKKEISDCLEFYYDGEHDYGEVWCVQDENRVLIATADSEEEFDLLKEVLL